MLGKSHVAVGAAGFLTVAAPVYMQLGGTLSPADLAAGTAVAAGAALLPDLDHPKATVSRAFGPFSWFASRLIAFAAGGHRNGTHSLLALLVVAAGMWFAVGVDNPVAMFAIAWVNVALACRLFMPRFNDLTSAAVASVVAAGVVSVSPTMHWMPLAVTAGYALHLLADMVTKEGVPLAWPVSKRRTRIPVMRTGSALEGLTAISCGVVAVGAAWLMIFVPAMAA